MEQKLPQLNLSDLRLTRDFLRDIALSIGCFQRAFLPKTKELWEHGLIVTMRGFSTQSFKIEGDEITIGVDLVRHRVRLGELNWPLSKIDGAELLNQLKNWLRETYGLNPDFDEPRFSGDKIFDKSQADLYAQALWWLERRFEAFRKKLETGKSSPILLYPHHFDLSLSWFPEHEHSQINLGWSTGDEFILEPYIYFTAYPEIYEFTNFRLPAESYWYSEGFNGAILTYERLRKHPNPVKLLDDFCESMFRQGAKLLEST